MTGAASLRELLARVEAADGPDREIDQDLFCDLGLCARGEDGLLDAYRAPHYTASLDAAVVLVERLLPAGSWEVSREGGGAAEAGFEAALDALQDYNAENCPMDNQTTSGPMDEPCPLCGAEADDDRCRAYSDSVQGGLLGRLKEAYAAAAPRQFAAGKTSGQGEGGGTGG